MAHEPRPWPCPGYIRSDAHERLRAEAAEEAPRLGGHSHRTFHGADRTVELSLLPQAGGHLGVPGPTRGPGWASEVPKEQAHAWDGGWGCVGEGLRS